MSPSKVLILVGFIWLHSTSLVQAKSDWHYETDAKSTNKTNIQTLVDPTKPINYRKYQPRARFNNKGLTLNSVVVKANNSFAVINNRIYHQGEKVHGVKIKKITKEQVFLANGQKLTLFKTVSQ